MKTKSPHIHKQAPAMIPEAVSQEKWSLDTPFLIALALAFCFAAFHVLTAFLPPDYLFWGVNMLRYLPTAAMLFPVLAVAGILWVWLGPKGSAPSPKMYGWIIHMIIPAMLIVVLVISNIHAFLLGDGGNVTKQIIISSRGVHVASRAPLSLLFMQWMYRVSDLFNPATPFDNQKLVSDVLTHTVRDNSNAEFSFALAGILLILILYFVLVRVGTYFVEAPSQRVWAILFILGSGTLVLFAGYIEYYLLPCVLLVLFILSVIYALNEQKHAWLPAALLACTIASHVGLLAYAPVLALMLWHVFGKSIKKLVLYCGITAVAGLGILALAGYSPETHIYIFLAKSTEAGSHFIPFFHTASKAQAYTAFSIYHFTDLANLFLLVNPAGILIMFLFLPKIFREKLFLKPVEGTLLLSVLISLGMLFIANCDIGMVADWDFLALYTLPVTIAGAWFLLKHGSASRSGILKLCSIVLVMHTGLWLWNLADDQASVRRLIALQNTKTFSPDGLLYTTTHLTRYYSERNNFTEMTKPYERMINELNPNDPRAYFSLSRLYTRMKNNAAAEAILKKALEKGIDDYRIDGALGDAHMARQEFHLAIPLYKAYLDKYPSTNNDSTGRGKGWLAMARAYLGIDSLSQSVEAYKQGLRLDTENVEGMAQLAIVYIRMNASNEAIPLLRKVVQNTTNTEQRAKAAHLLKLCEGQ
jgi:hypothetical protein